VSSTRSIISPPPFAANALTVIPPTPVAGVSYRDPVAGPASSPDGWPYAERVNSAEWNQIMYQLSSLVSIMDLKGILGWSDQKRYTEAAIAFGSDGNLYTWIQDNGPGSVAGVQDPVSSPLYWTLALISAKEMQSVTATVAANALTVTWAPQPIQFRNPTLTSGTAVTSTPSAPLTLTVPSTATLGTISGQQAQLMFLVAYNAGVPVLCVVNIAGGLDLSETGLISPTTISTGANSAGVIYSASSVAANSPYRVVGSALITEATAGTWATGPTSVQGVGGQAFATMQSFGFGQAWQSVTRNAATTYYNTTSKPIAWRIVQAQATTFTPTIGGFTFPSYSSGAGDTTSHTFIIPPGQSYSYAGATQTSTELR
jgi:hypothetical protein